MKREILIIFLIILNYSCSSEDSTEVQQTGNFYALTIGNSWEYKYYLKDIAANDLVATSVTETIDITATIAINNSTYYNFRHIVNGNDGNYNTLPSDGEQNYTLRDSLGYLIDEVGLIRYNNSNYNQHFVNYNTDFGDFAYYLKLSEEEDNIITNAGSFLCYDNHYFFNDSNGNTSNSLDHIYREDGKGEILSTMSFISESEPFAEKRLESYTLQ